MEAPAELTLGDRIHWAALAAIVGVLHDGPELGTDRRLFDRLEAACRSFGVPREKFDDSAKLLNFHYVRNGDYYAGREDLAEIARHEAIIAGLRTSSGTLH